MQKTRRIHIVGSGPRTGTTLLTEVMRVCYDFDYVSEHEDSICRSNLNIGKGLKTILTKHPAELYGIEYPLWADPNLYIICIIRDPRDMISSFHGKYPDKYWASLRYWNLFLKAYKKLERHPRILFFKYEEFTTLPNMAQQKINEKFPFLEQKKEFDQYHLYAAPSKASLNALKTMRPIEPKGIGNWKNHLPRIKQQIRLHGDISKSLIKLKYETSADWMQMLEGIEIGDFQTKTQEFYNKKHLSSKKKSCILATLKILIEKTGIEANRILKLI